MTVRCPQRLSQGGFHGDETRSMLIPDPLVAVCPGDFLTSTTVGSELEAALISTVARIRFLFWSSIGGVTASGIGSAVLQRQGGANVKGNPLAGGRQPVVRGRCTARRRGCTPEW